MADISVVVVGYGYAWEITRLVHQCTYYIAVLISGVDLS